MNRNNPEDLPSPYPEPESGIDRYYEWLTTWSRKNPSLFATTMRVLGVSSLTLAAAAVSSFLAGYNIPAGIAAALSLGGAATYGANWLGLKLNGLRYDDSQQVYKEAEYKFNTAQGKMVIEAGSMPRLIIEAQESYDAGFVEGRLLAPAMRDNLSAVSIMNLGMYLIGKPLTQKKMEARLAPIKNQIPEAYQKEMQGKVDGYNSWLQENHPNEAPMTLEYYLLLQLLPDIFNYNPFRKSIDTDQVIKTWLPLPGCTTYVLRDGDYIFYNRILDWPSYGKAGGYFLQVDRKIGNALRHIDIGIPLLSGALTVTNENMMFQMNVSEGEKVTTARGMPAVFVNRFLAENTRSAADVWQWIFVGMPTESGALQRLTPLGPYHLTFMDAEAKDVHSIHFYQNPKNLNEHLVDQLSLDEGKPQLLVVANEGMKLVRDVPTTTNHNDSFQRKANIFSLFEKTPLPSEIKSENDKQIQDFCSAVANLPLVKNRKSVLWSQYVVHDRKIVKATVATDNNYVQEDKCPDKKLTIPGKA